MNAVPRSTAVGSNCSQIGANLEGRKNTLPQADRTVATVNGKLVLNASALCSMRSGKRHSNGQRAERRRIERRYSVWKIEDWRLLCCVYSAVNYIHRHTHTDTQAPARRITSERSSAFLCVAGSRPPGSRECIEHDLKR